MKTRKNQKTKKYKLKVNKTRKTGGKNFNIDHFVEHDLDDILNNFDTEIDTLTSFLQDNVNEEIDNLDKADVKRNSNNIIHYLKEIKRVFKDTKEEIDIIKNFALLQQLYTDCMIIFNNKLSTIIGLIKDDYITKIVEEFIMILEDYLQENFDRENFLLLFTNLEETQQAFLEINIIISQLNRKFGNVHSIEEIIDFNKNIKKFLRKNVPAVTKYENEEINVDELSELWYPFWI